MIIKFALKTNNDAFTENPANEIRRIIRQWLAGSLTAGSLKDANGNTVGAVSLSGTQAERLHMGTIDR